MTKTYAEIKVGKTLLKKIDFDTKFTITANINGKKIKHVLSVVGICNTGIIDLRGK